MHIPVEYKYNNDVCGALNGIQWVMSCPGLGNGRHM